MVMKIIMTTGREEEGQPSRVSFLYLHVNYAIKLPKYWMILPTTVPI